MVTICKLVKINSIFVPAHNMTLTYLIAQLLMILPELMLINITSTHACGFVFVANHNKHNIILYIHTSHDCEGLKRPRKKWYTSPFTVTSANGCSTCATADTLCNSSFGICSLVSLEPNALARSMTAVSRDSARSGGTLNGFSILFCLAGDRDMARLEDRDSTSTVFEAVANSCQRA